MSSDSHTAVSVWRIRERRPGSLEADALARTLAPALDAADADALRALVPGDFTPGAQTWRIRGGTADGSMSEPQEERLLRVGAMAAAFWELVDIEAAAVFADHALPCLALAFVPALPTTLVWLESAQRVHIADVAAPARAHRIVHLSTLPLQIALAADDGAAVSSYARVAPPPAAAPPPEAHDAPEPSSDDDVQERVRLWEILDRVQRAWNLQNNVPQQLAVPAWVPAARCTTFPTYRDVVEGAWGPSADEQVAAGQEIGPVQFVREVVRELGVQPLPRSRQQEEAVAVRRPPPPSSLSVRLRLSMHLGARSEIMTSARACSASCWASWLPMPRPLQTASPALPLSAAAPWQ